MTMTIRERCAAEGITFGQYRQWYLDFGANEGNHNDRQYDTLVDYIRARKQPNVPWIYQPEPEHKGDLDNFGRGNSGERSWS